MIAAWDGSVSGTAVRALVNRRLDAASASRVGATPTPRRSARNVSMVTKRTFGLRGAGSGLAQAVAVRALTTSTPILMAYG
ncbi:MAG TPA: hypothetical protein VGH34_07575 [Vicinamibacterales bacterium]